MTNGSQMWRSGTLGPEYASRTMPRSSPPSDSPHRNRPNRAPVALDVVVQHPLGGASRFARLTNLSIGGARLETQSGAAENDVVDLLLPWPSRDAPTKLSAVVRWVEPDAIGIQFTMEGPDEAKILSRLVEDHALKGEGPDAPRRPTTKGFSRDELLAEGTPVLSLERRVRFQEVDAAGTIYYSRVFEFFGDVYIDVIERNGLRLPSEMAKGEWYAPLIHAEADYLAPMRFGDIVLVSVVKIACGGSSATVGYRIASRDGRPLVVGHTVHVFVDGKTFRPCPIPDAVRAALTGE